MCAQLNYMVMPGLKQTRSKARPMVAVKIERDIVLKCVCEHFNVSIDDLKKISRKREVVYKRQMAMYFMVNYTTDTYLEIGQFFGKDHTTVIYGKDLVREQIELDDNVKNDIEAIKVRIVEAYY